MVTRTKYIVIGYPIFKIVGLPKIDAHLLSKTSLKKIDEPRFGFEEVQVFDGLCFYVETKIDKSVIWLPLVM